MICCCYLSRAKPARNGQIQYHMKSNKRQLNSSAVFRRSQYVGSQVGATVNLRNTQASFRTQLNLARTRINENVCGSWFGSIAIIALATMNMLDSIIASLSVRLSVCLSLSVTNLSLLSAIFDYFSLASDVNANVSIALDGHLQSR